MEAFFQNHHQWFVIDDSRREFLQDVEITLRDLVEGKLVMSSSFRRLLLGGKGVGKSVFLEIMGHAANALYPRLLVVHVDYTNGYRAQLPSKIASRRLSLDLADIASLDHHLHESGQYVFLIIDELNTVFTGGCPLGQEILGELAEIGRSRAGRMHCILSGSSSRLRQLCFAKLPQEDRHLFPNYQGIDMNSTRFSARWIYPFLDWETFERVTKLCRFASHSQVDQQDEIMQRAYIETSGNPRLMEDFYRNGKVDTYSLSLRSVSTEEKNLLRIIYSCTCDFQPASCQRAILYWTRFISVSSIQAHLRDKGVDSNLDMSTVYNLTDRGLIRYDDRVSQNNEPCISLGSTAVFLELSGEGRCELTTREATALLYPNGVNHDFAERVAMRFIAMKAKEWLVDKEELRSFDVQDLCITGDSAKTSLHQKHLAALSSEEVTDRLWKEVPDAYGTDVLLMRQTAEVSSKHVAAHRVQLKLGTELIRDDEAEKIVHRFRSMRSAFEEAMAGCGYTVTNQTFYVVTTRPIEPSAKELLMTSSDIQLVGQRQLKERVWPRVVVSLGKPYA